MSSPDLESLYSFFCANETVLDDYVREIANGPGLSRYKTIIQGGGKQGQPLFTHVIDLVFTLDRLSEPLALSDIEQRVLMLALSIHDFNKIYDQPGRFPDITQPDNLRPELERIGADRFFSKWKEYLEDIAILVKAHSGHYFHSGELLMGRNAFALSNDRIPELIELVKGLDILDMSHELTERTHKRTFIDRLNSISDVPYEFVHHVVAEQRGILTNAIHHCIAEFMAEHKAARPLLYYPDGVAYLVKRGQALDVSEADYLDLAARVTEFFEGQTRGNYRDFIKAGNQGIKIDQKCLELGVSFGQIWGAIDGIVSRKRYKIAEMEAKARVRAEKNLSGQEGLQADGARALLNSARLMAATDEGMQRGELIRSYYIFVNTHFKQQIPDAWSHIYPLIDVPEEEQEVYDFLDQNYDRSYVIAPRLSLSYDDISARFDEDGSALLERTESESPWQPIFEDYVRQIVRFSFQMPTLAEFGAQFERYVGQNHTQSAYSSTTFPTEHWMSGDVPKNIKVQQFSNRLGAGGGEPKKRIDPLTKAQFLLEKLNYAPGGRGAKTYYLHMYPYAFFSHDYLQLWRDTVQSWVEQDVTALFIKADDILRSFFEDRPQPQLQASAVNSNGLPLPRTPALMGNVMIWPLNAPGSNDTERFWYAFTCALSLQRFLGARVVLSQSSVPIVGQDEFQDLLLDELPLGLEGVLEQNAFDHEALQRLWKRLKALYVIRNQVYNPRSKVNEILALSRSLLDGPLGIFYTAERLQAQRISADKKARSPEWNAIYSAQAMIEHLGALSIGMGGKRMIEVIQKLAKLAWAGRLRGESLKKNSLMMPLDHCFDKLQQQHDPLDRGTLRAATIEDIYAYLERIREEGMTGQTTRDKATNFVDAFYTDLLDDCYRNNLQQMLNDEKLIRSAYIFHVRGLIAERTAQNKAKKADEKEATPAN